LIESGLLFVLRFIHEYHNTAYRSILTAFDLETRVTRSSKSSNTRKHSER